MHHIQDNIEQHIEQHTEQRTEQTQYPDTEQTQPQHRCITYDLHKYSFDFITYNNISKNSIIQLYTNIIHFAHLIDEVTKITITLIYFSTLYKKLLYHDIDKPYIFLFNCNNIDILKKHYT